MKYLIACFILLSACGNQSINNEAVGQVKKVVNQTPLICSERNDVDMSLGIMRNGSGSMSTEDQWFTLSPAFTQIEALKAAAANGSIVKVHYLVKRVTFCNEDHQIVSFEVVK